MDSPFYPNQSNESTQIVMYVEPYLNTYFQSYQKIITFSSMPVGPLANMSTMISIPKLSVYHNNHTFSSNPNNCLCALLRYPKNGYVGGVKSSFKMADYFMGPEDIPAVFSYLISNGYIIDTDFTKMLRKSGFGGVSDSRLSGNRKMICIFHGGIRSV